MPIPIIENFQLGTNLPLDARYVVGDPYDVSLYWFDGMQMYQSSTGRLYVVIDSSLQTIEDVLYRAEFDSSYGAIDNSLNYLYNSVLDISQNKLSYITLAGSGQSIIADSGDQPNEFFAILKSLDASDYISITNDGSTLYIGVYGLPEFSYVDGSLLARDLSISWNYQQIAQLDASIQRIDASLSDYVRKDGDTMTGPLLIDSSLRVLDKASFFYNVDIRGDLRVDGSTSFLHTDVLDVSTGWIRLNTGLTGPPPAWLQSGILIERGDASSYAFAYDETRQEFRVGIVGTEDASGVYSDHDTQAVATREDVPVPYGIATYNSDEYRFDTSAGLTYDGSVLSVTGDVSISGRITAANINVNVPGLPGNPEGGDMVYLSSPYNKPFWYDASRGRWTSGQVSYGCGRNSANRNTDAYMLVGGGAMTSVDGIQTPHNGIISGCSVSIDTPIAAVAGRTLQIRVNNSTSYAVNLVIPQGAIDAYSDFENLDVSAGDIIQAVLLANGTDNVGNIIATFEITERP